MLPTVARVSFDWQGLERRERERNDRLAFQLGLGWAGLGVGGLVIVLLTGQDRLLVGGVFWLVIGAVLVAVAYPRSSRRHHGGDDVDPDVGQ
jgi:hypothetical protein